MPTLIRAHRDALHVFLQGSGDHVIDRTVVTEVDHLRAHALQNAAHDVDGRVVAIEQAGGGDKAHLVLGAVLGEGLVFGGQVSHQGLLRAASPGPRLWSVPGMG